MTQPADGVAKTCFRCGGDVSLQPRMKDKAGRYYCKPCVRVLKVGPKPAAAPRPVRQPLCPPPLPVATPSPPAVPISVAVTPFENTTGPASPRKVPRLAIVLGGSVLGLFVIAGIVMIAVHRKTVATQLKLPPAITVPRLPPITMRDASLLENRYTDVKELGFAIRAPRGWVTDTNINRRMGITDRKDPETWIGVVKGARTEDFDAYVSKVHDLLKAKYTIQEEGVAALCDRQVRVVKYMARGGYQCRDIIIDAPGNTVYTIQCRCAARNWDRELSVFDSSVSTFALGLWAEPAGQSLLPAPPAPCEEALAQLDDPNSRRFAIVALAGMKSDDAHRADVVAKLLLMLDDTQGDIRNKAVAALKQWMNQDSEAALIARLPSAGLGGHLLIQLLGTFKTATAADALANRLGDRNNSQAAVSALINIGSEFAEPAAANVLNNGNAQCRVSASYVLAMVGTRASLPAMDEMAHNSDPSIRKDGQFAANQIRKRLP